MAEVEQGAERGAAQGALDQFYTRPEVAARCLETLAGLVDMRQFDVLLEPSAGTGSFFLQLDERREGLDVQPKCAGVRQLDFFEYKPRVGRYLVVGNPPFGRVSSLAVRFFNKTAEFADCIAFIVPRTFKRVSVQNRLSLDFTLLHSEDIPLGSPKGDLPQQPCCFEPPMAAKCCFQVWTRSAQPRRRVALPQSHPHFSFLKHGPRDSRGQPTPPHGADFALRAYGSNCGTLRDDDLHTLRPKSWHWIQAHIDPDTLKTRFCALDYSISKDSVRQDSLGQRELIELYIQKYASIN